MTVPSVLVEQPLVVITEALQEVCGAKLKVPTPEKVYLSWGFDYPSESHLQQPRLAMESSVLWEKDDRRVGFTNLIEEIPFAEWQGMKAYYDDLNRWVAPFVVEYLPQGGLDGHLTPFWLGDHEERTRLVPAYWGLMSCEVKANELQRLFLDYLGCSSIILLLTSPIFRRIAAGERPGKSTCIDLLAQELNTHRFFIEEQKRLRRKEEQAQGDPEDAEQEIKPRLN